MLLGTLRHSRSKYETHGGPSMEESPTLYDGLSSHSHDEKRSQRPVPLLLYPSAHLPVPCSMAIGPVLRKNPLRIYIDYSQQNGFSPESPAQPCVRSSIHGRRGNVQLKKRNGNTTNFNSPTSPACRNAPRPSN